MKEYEPKEKDFTFSKIQRIRSTVRKRDESKEAARRAGWERHPSPTFETRKGPGDPS